MTIKSSGTLWLSEIRNEFGGSAEYRLSQFYRGGGRVPDVSVNNNISTSGKIAISMFYGASNYTPGSASYTAPGYYVFTVPAGVTTLNVDMVGGGASGRPGAIYSDSYNQWLQYAGNDGGASSLAGLVSAAGGTTGATSVYNRYSVAAGAGGSVGGGAANQSNGDGGDGGSTAWGSGGAHGTTNCYKEVTTGDSETGYTTTTVYDTYSYVGGATTPGGSGTGYGAGGGGGGGWSDSGPGAGGAGGGAGTRVTTNIAVTPGQQIGVTVGAGGAAVGGYAGTGAGGAGFGGMVYLAW